MTPSKLKKKQSDYVFNDSNLELPAILHILWQSAGNI